MRMLAYCFKDKTKYKFLQKCRGLSIFQSACQFVIVITGAVDSWRIFNDRSYNPGQPCNVVKLFSISFTFVQACNLTAILCIDSEHPLVTFRHQDRCSKLKIAAAVTLGLIGSSMIWWFSCFICLRDEVFLTELMNSMSICTLSKEVNLAFLIREYPYLISKLTEAFRLKISADLSLETLLNAFVSLDKLFSGRGRLLSFFRI